MIFVTAGTERFPFDRLIQAVDVLQGSLNGEDVFMQTGSSSYQPSCPYEHFIPYHDFCEKILEARIVISHAGAGTLLMCEDLGKVPVMLARQGDLGEHVDDHQQMLARRMADQGRIILADRAEDIPELIHHYDDELSLATRNAHTKELGLVHYLRELLHQY